MNSKKITDMLLCTTPKGSKVYSNGYLYKATTPSGLNMFCNVFSLQLLRHLCVPCSFIFFLFIYSCNNSTINSDSPTDTTTSGEVNIVVDEGYRPLFETEIFTFESLYTRAHVHVKYKNETEALNDVLNDSCKVAVINRDLTEEEKKYFESKNLYPKSTKIAEDAVAFVVNNGNSDTNITYVNIMCLISGADTSWQQVNPKSKLKKPQIIFDNSGSANAKYIANFNKDPHLPKNSFAVNSNSEVIEYVSDNPSAIGVISVNWISDRDDSLTMKYLKMVKVAGISSFADTSKYFKPYQAYIKTKEYPFTRDVYMINRQTRAGLGMGFVSFVAGDAGQRIILKMGLIPAIAPTRVVKFN